MGTNRCESIGGIKTYFVQRIDSLCCAVWLLLQQLQHLLLQLLQLPQLLLLSLLLRLLQLLQLLLLLLYRHAHDSPAHDVYQCRCLRPLQEASVDCSHQILRRSTSGAECVRSMQAHDTP